MFGQYQPLEQFSVQIDRLLGHNCLPYYKSITPVSGLLDGIIITNMLSIILITFVLIYGVFFWLRLDRNSNLIIKTFRIYFFIVEEFFTQLDYRCQMFLVAYWGVFVFFLVGNVLGLLPFFPTIASQFIFNLTISSSMICGITLLGFSRFGFHFLQLFKPSGVPKILLGFMVLLEILSYITRIFSLSLRLFSNMLSGHTLLHFIHFLSFELIGVFEQEVRGMYFIILSLVPFLLISIIFAFEMLVALLQAYVLATLFVVYLQDVFPHHGG